MLTPPSHDSDLLQEALTKDGHTPAQDPSALYNLYVNNVAVMFLEMPVYLKQYYSETIFP